jgi:hypothetical protein
VCVAAFTQSVQSNTAQLVYDNKFADPMRQSHSICTVNAY